MSRFAGASMVEQQYRIWEMERQRKRNEYWLMLKRARNEYYDLVSGVPDVGMRENDFYYYMQHNYGVKVNLVDGKIDSSYQITDEKKHMLFIMKYSS
jgi:hypothetical protein